MIIICAIITWLICGATGSIIGIAGLQRTFPAPLSKHEIWLSAVSTIAGPFNILATIIVFWVC